jgi:hypothetical protein
MDNARRMEAARPLSGGSNMTHANLRRVALGAVAALALAAAPAQADDGSSGAVCNPASPHFQGGGMVATDAPVDSPAARYTDDLSLLPGVGEGLVGAAANSPALSGCEDGSVPTAV